MVRTGFRAKSRQAADPGDITGTPGIIWSVKDRVKDQHGLWMAELDAMALPPGGGIRLLVHKRAGYADAERWWCWMRQSTLWGLLGISWLGIVDPDDLIRMELHTAVDLLIAAGFIPTEEEEES
jgi:hypothetical protein